MRAKFINEDLPVGLWSDSNTKAVKSWVDASKKRQKIRIKTIEPLDLVIDEESDLAKLKYVLNKHRVKYFEEKL